MSSTKTIVFIHGLFMTPKSWNHWIKYFENKGYVCHAPAYPYHEREIKNLQQSPDPKLGTLTLREVTTHITKFIDTLEEKPILIGHSMGGLVVQKLIAEQKGVAGICIDAAPPKGIFSFKWSFLKSNLPTINPLAGNSNCVMDVKRFHYTFCNTMSLEETQQVINEFVVPESRNIARSSTGRAGTIDFQKPRAPLLFIAGEKDNIIPSSLNRKNYEAYKDVNSKKEFKEFAGRTHYICGQKNWEEVADYIAKWIKIN